MGRLWKNSIGLKLYLYTVSMILMMSFLSAFIFITKTNENDSYESILVNIGRLDGSADRIDSIAGKILFHSSAPEPGLEEDIKRELKRVRNMIELVEAETPRSNDTSLHSIYGIADIAENLGELSEQVVSDRWTEMTEISRYESLEYIDIIPGIYRKNVFRYTLSELSYLRTNQESIRNENRVLGTVLVVLIVMSTAVIVLLIFFINRMIISPLKNLENAALEYQEKDQFLFPDYKRDDEIGHLNKAFKDLFERVGKREKDLKTLRNYLVNIIDSMPSEIVGVDNLDAVTLWNKAISDRTGIPKAEALGKTLSAVSPSLSVILGEARGSLDAGEVYSERSVLDTGGGEAVSYDAVAFPVSGKKDEDMVIRLDDITERLKIEQILVQNEKMLALGGLAAGMAHEVNSPLTVVLNTAELLRLHLSDSESDVNIQTAQECGISLSDLAAYLEKRDVIAMLDAIIASSMKVGEIVRNMLRFARKSEKTKRMHDPVKIIEETIGIASADLDMEKGYDFRRVSIIRDFGEDLPLVPCIRTNIQQVILNVLRNAAQAMHASPQSGDRKPAIAIRVYPDPSRDMLSIEIRDNGPGMSEDVQGHVFEPFYTTKAVGVGTGLGLSVSYFIITENHDGEMRVESREGEGSTFFIGLPLSNHETSPE